MPQAERDNDSVSLKDVVDRVRILIRFLAARWLYLAAGLVLGAAAGFYYSTTSRPEYTAECTFVLEEKQSGGIGQYAGVASMIGLDLGGSGASGIFDGDNIIELYKSRLMLRRALLSEVRVNGKNELLVDRYVAMEGLREQWADDPGLRKFTFNPDDTTSYTQDSLLAIFVKDIRDNKLNAQKPDKRLSLISVKVMAKDPIFAKEFTWRLVNNVNTFYLDYKMGKSTVSMDILQRQADSIRRDLNNALSGAASAVDLTPNPNPAKQLLRVPSQRRQIDVEKNAAIYGEIEKNLMLTKLTLLGETPLLKIIDRPELPLEVKVFGKAKGLVFGGAVGCFLVLASFFLVWIFSKLARL